MESVFMGARRCAASLSVLQAVKGLSHTLEARSAILMAFSAAGLAACLRSCYVRLHAEMQRTAECMSSYEPLQLSNIVVHDLAIDADAARAESCLSQWILDFRAGHHAAAIGLDVEWVKGGPPALLQLSNGKMCLLLRLCNLPHPFSTAITRLPRSLVELLQADWVVKAGVGITTDVVLLQDAFGLEVNGATELVPLAAITLGHDGPGLKQLAAQVLHHRLPKVTAVRCSNWAAPVLSVSQCHYAAEDANVALSILLTLYSQCGSRHLSIGEWARSHHGRAAEFDTARAAPRSRRRENPEGKCSQDPQSAQQTGATHTVVQQSVHPSGSEDGSSRLGSEGTASESASARGCVKPNRMKLRAGALYDGWRMLAPSGDTMCRLNRSRALWYVERGLAQLEDGVDACIRLNFEPKGLGNAAEPWLIEPKANACVGCGVPQRRTGVHAHTVQASFMPTSAGQAATTGSAGDHGGRTQGVNGYGGQAQDVHGQTAHATEREADASSETSSSDVVGLLRWSVVPPAFRRLLPEALKSRDSHDIVLLCASCHRVVERPYAQHRRALFVHFCLEEDTARLRDSPQRARVRSAANALAKPATRAKLPAARRAALEAVVREHFGAAELTQQMIKAAAVIDTKCERTDYVPPEEKLMMKLQSQGDATEEMLRLVTSWRQLFVDVLKPKNLPTGWSVKHRAENVDTWMLASDSGRDKQFDPGH